MMDKPAVGRIEFGPSATDGRDEERVDVVLGGAADVVALRARVAELEQALSAERARAEAAEADAAAMRETLTVTLTGETGPQLLRRAAALIMSAKDTVLADAIEERAQVEEAMLEMDNPGASLLAVVEAARRWQEVRKRHVIAYTYDGKPESWDAIRGAEQALDDALAALNGGGGAGAGGGDGGNG